jgi:hypothetical protein
MQYFFYFFLRKEWEGPPKGEEENATVLLKMPISADLCAEVPLAGAVQERLWPLGARIFGF